MSAPTHPTQSQPTQPPPAWQPHPEWEQTTNPTPPPQRKPMRVIRFIIAMIAGFMAAMFAVGIVTVIGLYEVAPDFAQGLEGITFLAGWVGGSWLVLHFWPMPVVRTVLPHQWGQRPDQEADR